MALTTELPNSRAELTRRAHVHFGKLKQRLLWDATPKRAAASPHSQTDYGLRKGRVMGTNESPLVQKRVVIEGNEKEEHKPAAPVLALSCARDCSVHAHKHADKHP